MKKAKLASGGDLAGRAWPRWRGFRPSRGARLVLPALLVAACATPVGVGTSLPAGDARAIARALGGGRALPGGPANAAGRPLLFALVRGAAGTRLVGFDLDAGRTIWHEPAAITHRPVVGRSVVVYGAADGALVARDVATGVERWREPLPAGQVRIGVATDEDVVYEVTEPAGAAAGQRREGHLVARAAVSGSQRWRRALVGPLGAPAARDGIVAVPRQSQYVTLLGAGGDARAEILSRRQAASFVVARPEGFFFGSRGVFLLGPETALGEPRPGVYLSATLPAFVRPQYERDMYRPELAAPTALDRNRILWRVSAQPRGIVFDGGLVVAHAFRFFFGLDATSGDLRWAYSHPRVDAVASEHTGPSVLFVSADGEVGALDARTGQRLYRASLGTRADEIVEGAVFDADRFAGSGGPGAAGPPSLVATLSSVIRDPDTRFGAVKLFAARALARQPGPDAARALLDALDAAHVPGEVADVAAEALVKRQDRALLPLHLEALRVRPDYVEDQSPRRLEMTIQMVAALGSKEAMPALLEHLRFPETDPEAVRHIAAAAQAAGAKEAIGPLLGYLVQHRADQEAAARPAVLRAVCDALLALGGDKERALLRRLVDDSKTIEPLATHLRRAFETQAP